MPVRRIVPDLHADDPARARAFCEDVLGLEVAMDQGWVMTFAAPGNPAVQLTVTGPDAGAAVSPDVSVEVEDVEAAHAAAVAAGYEIVHPLTDEAWGVRRFFVREPASGAVVNVLAHRADESAAPGGS
jgi:catechol 2,3-dioxygenase-like lactoylglutathione lyase family enzyme